MYHVQFEWHITADYLECVRKLRAGFLLKVCTGNSDRSHAALIGLDFKNDVVLFHNHQVYGFELMNVC